ncbi:MAG: phosphoribosylformylglycinamidine synthase subunit PurS, partial [Candidatus Kapaibacterium sp.]
EHALHTMGYTSVGNVRMGKHVTFTVQADSADSAKTIARESCEKLIANPIMEDFEIRIEEVA